MNLLLAINRERRTTCIMVRPAYCMPHAGGFVVSSLSLHSFCHRVHYFDLRMTQFCAGQVTHNPDLECYADRVLYLQDGRIVK
jgi:hypothetical protein